MYTSQNNTIYLDSFSDLSSDDSKFFLTAQIEDRLIASHKNISERNKTRFSGISVMNSPLPVGWALCLSWGKYMHKFLCANTYRLCINYNLHIHIVYAFVKTLPVTQKWLELKDRYVYSDTFFAQDKWFDKYAKRVNEGSMPGEEIIYFPKLSPGS